MRIEEGNYLAIRYDAKKSRWITANAKISLEYVGKKRDGSEYTMYKLSRDNMKQNLTIFGETLATKIDNPSGNYMYSKHMTLEEMQEAIITYNYNKAVDLRDKSEEMLNMVQKMQDLSESKLRLV